MKLKDGKFYNDAGERVPIEFGNKEQIALIERHESFREAIASDGLIILPEFNGVNVEAKFQCICDNILTFSCEGESVEAAEKLIGQIKTCKCDKQYKVDFWLDDYGIMDCLVVKEKKLNAKSRR